MIDTPHLTASLSSEPIDLPQIDSTLAIVRRAERSVATMAVYLAEARDALAASPGDPKAARRIMMTRLRMRADALSLAEDFATMAWPIEG